ncbi:MAG: thioesterase family protein, partial [Chitinophagales bacterium]
MKDIFQPGDRKYYERKVLPEDRAHFEEGGTVHQVYATFNLARDAEWSTRLFVLDMKEADEEGIGTFIEVLHVSPALIGQKVHFTAVIDAINGHEILCSFEARVGERI